jgi:hypothetical protein
LAIALRKRDALRARVLYAQLLAGEPATIEPPVFSDELDVAIAASIVDANCDAIALCSARMDADRRSGADVLRVGNRHPARQTRTLATRNAAGISRAQPRGSSELPTLGMS